MAGVVSTICAGAGSLPNRIVSIAASSPSRQFTGILFGRRARDTESAASRVADGRHRRGRGWRQVPRSPVRPAACRNGIVRDWRGGPGYRSHVVVPREYVPFVVQIRSETYYLTSGEVVGRA